MVWKMTWGIKQIFPRALERAFESLKIGTLMASFCLKLKMYELKTNRGVMYHENKEWFKIWREIDFAVPNWHEPGTRKSQKCVLSWAAFDQSIKCLS